MKFFVSSLINGMEVERAAVIDAVEGLGHQVIRAEDFTAKPESPQVACLKAVRACDAYVLIAGAHYGHKQASGKSATHEEYDAASGTKPIFVFIDARSTAEADQANFLRQVQDWRSGEFTAQFNTAEQLRKEASKALHQWIMAQAAGAFDPTEALERAIGALPPQQRGYTTGHTKVAVSIAAGPAQIILRPAEIEDPRLVAHLTKEALFGSPSIFTSAKGTKSSIEGHALVLRQEPAALSVSEDGSIVIVDVLSEAKGGIPALIEEELTEKLASAFTFTSSVLDHIDATHRLTHVALSVNLYEADFLSWRTRAQHAASPSAGTMNMRHGESAPVTLQPAHRPRQLLKRDASMLAKDFTVLLRRAWTRN